MAIAASVGLGLAGIVVAVDVKQFEALRGFARKDVVVCSSLSRRIRDAQEKLRHVVAFLRGELPPLPFVVDGRVPLLAHGRSEAAVDQMPRGAFRLIDLTVGRNTLSYMSAVDATIRVAGDAVPVKRSSVSQAANRHRRTRHDLVAARNDRSFQHPQQLVGMSVRMTACA